VGVGSWVVSALAETLSYPHLERLEAREPPTDPKTSVGIVLADGQRQFLAHAPDPLIVAAITRQLRMRRDWLDIPGTSEQVQKFAVVVLRTLGIGERELEAIANSTALQLTFPPGLPDAAMRFPWEFGLAEATRPSRRRVAHRPGRSFLAYRYLAPANDAPAPADLRTPVSSLVVQSAPGPLKDTYTFESECRMVESALDLERQAFLDDPDLGTLEQRVKASSPSVIHVAGVDARQARTLLDADESEIPSVPEDGLCLANGEHLTIAPYADLAKALTAGAGGAQLVTLNLYNSSLGAMETVRAGAAAAIGFQDDIDDLVAEQFFGSFYSAWKRSRWDLLAGFLGGWLALTPYAEKVRGTGIVLWSRYPLLAQRGTGTGRGGAPRPESTSTGTGSGSTTGVRVPKDVEDAAAHIDVEYAPPLQLNYSLLHNNVNIVPKLVIRRQKPGIYRSITVHATVSAGTQEASYRAMVTLNDAHPKEDAHEKIRIPLTSELTRTLDESLYSTIYMAVRWGDHVLLEQTDRVAFMPVDEWKYDDTNARWLPSFIFPRDPVVREIVTTAQRYLVALRDDSTAGFDGYQSFDATPASIEDRSRHIDAQVQALWWALINDYALGYINPPPNYSDAAQRLRTPSEVLAGRRGTCIDLALLLAACLEYVEIHPVIFMLNDHAFPGYWRSEESYGGLSRLSLKVADDTAAAAVPITDRDMHPEPWMVGRARFSDITTLVQQGHIVPLETVALTARTGFWSAVDEGVSNLRSKRQFHSMFDLRTARTKVTPIPIWSKRG
jgi:hypothetical protein